MPEQAAVDVSLEFTPNPDVLKYVVNRVLLKSGQVSLPSEAEARRLSPLAARLFTVRGVAAVAISRDAVSVTKTSDGDWDVIHKSCVSAIEEHLGAGKPVLSNVAVAEIEKKAATGPTQADRDTETKIRDILDREIRPAVAMDGGDIEFVKYEDGVVYVRLQGACRGCPGARMTLKMGVERRICAAIPEVREVVAV